jgi:5'(3')-deoxyribonucleotidase
MIKKIAIVDIDGCLCEYPNDAFFSFVFDQTGKNFSDLQKLKAHLGGDYECIKSLYRESGLKKRLTFIPSSIMSLHRIRDLGYKIYIATSRPNCKTVIRDTHHWLSSNSVPFDELLFTGDKYIFQICTIDRDVIVIDDELKNLINYIDLEGVTVFHISQDVTKKLQGNNFHQISNWSEIIDYVELNSS